MKPSRLTPEIEQCVYGNDGWDVICDNTVNLEPWIGEGTAVDNLIQKYSD